MQTRRFNLAPVGQPGLAVGGRAWCLALLFWSVAAAGCVQPECSADGDCVPDSCCHPQGAVAQADAPECPEGTLCTEEYNDCSADNPNNVPVCLWGECVMRRAPVCGPIH